MLTLFLLCVVTFSREWVCEQGSRYSAGYRARDTTPILQTLSTAETVAAAVHSAVITEGKFACLLTTPAENQTGYDEHCDYIAVTEITHRA